MVGYVLSDGDKPGCLGEGRNCTSCRDLSTFLFLFVHFPRVYYIYQNLQTIHFFLYRNPSIFIEVSRPMQEAYIIENHINDSQYHLCEHHENLMHD